MKRLLILLFIFPQITFAKSLSDDWVGEPSSGFNPEKLVSAQKFMITSSHKLASKAGLEMLKKGGNAIDAAIAAKLVLNVVEPQSSGIGGGGFLLYYDAKSKKTTYFNGRETSPARVHERIFLDKNGKPMKFFDAVPGGLSVATPGLLKIFKKSHDKYGKLPWRDLFIPAIKIARNGFKVDSRLHKLANKINYLKDFEDSRNLFLNKEIGEIITNPKLAKTFTTIANKGISPFYKGQIAKDIAKAVKNSPRNPGYLSILDLKNYRAKIGEPICRKYRKKYKICSMPLPSSGGITLLQILGILENFDLKNLDPNDPKTIHLIIEATRLAYEDRNKYIGDGKNVPINQMLNSIYLKKRANLININKTREKFEPGEFKFDQVVLNSNEPPSTTHLSVIDDEGNALAFTSSVEYFFGSGMLVNGFLLNNHMTDFSFIPEINGKKVANRVEPKKQPRSSMTPTLVFDENDNLIMITGSPGGPRIIQHVLKSIITHLDWKMDIAKSISFPNFIVLNDRVELEKNTNITIIKKDLEKIGHNVKIKEITSGIHAIAIKNNKITASADFRRNGAALGQ